VSYSAAHEAQIARQEGQIREHEHTSDEHEHEAAHAEPVSHHQARGAGVACERADEFYIEYASLYK
jgi:hypothetical protein